jgi:hypothetical protein
MYAVEFQTTVRNGTIHIPPEYHKQFRHRVKVILMTEEVVEATNNLIDQLLANPIRLTGFRPLKREEVYAR